MLRFHSSSFMVSGIMTSILLTACVGQSSPPTRFFLLSPLSSHQTTAPKTPVTHPQKGLVVELEPVEIPQYLNRPEMVTRSGDNGLRLERLNQWAGDLKEDIGRVLMDNLSWILSSDQVMILPNRSEGTPNFRVMTSINRFEADVTGQVFLDARWTLFNGQGKPLLTHHSRITTQATNKEDYESLAGAMSQALAQWSQEIGTIILAQSGQPSP